MLRHALACQQKVGRAVCWHTFKSRSVRGFHCPSVVRVVIIMVMEGTSYVLDTERPRVRREDEGIDLVADSGSRIKGEERGFVDDMAVG